ncbi:nucleotidyltransferase domain-containing protein [Methanoculleus sp. 10]|uniref:nucleotidyltransferase domain-containing protein n=1 Tax=Methanoculleus sp. 10 TaxID=430615 RepID=UPI0025D7501B|nr:nucleotidyltransferase domain-containing protein [Methanoculleus sp. 10]
MLPVRRPIVHEFAAKARAACGDAIEEILLFGSVARGDDRPDSDIDILVITSEEDFRLREYLTGLAFDLLMLSGERLSVKVLSRADVCKRTGSTLSSGMFFVMPWRFRDERSVSTGSGSTSDQVTPASRSRTPPLGRGFVPTYTRTPLASAWWMNWLGLRTSSANSSSV